MSSGKMIFNVEEVGRLRTKMGQVSQDTNRLYMQVRGQSSNWSGIPLGANLQQAQVLINELTVEAEKLEELIQTAVKGVQNVQEENKRQSNQLFQQFGALGRLFERLGGGSITVQTVIPPTVRTAVTKLITTVATLSGRDELSRDPVVQKLEGVLKTSTFGSVDWFAAGTKLKEIYDARNQIAKAQTAYAVYQSFGNTIQMDAAHQLAEDARQRLEALGVNKLQYESGKDLSGYFKQTAIKACDYDPSITDKSVPLPEKENYAFLLRMAMEPGAKGEWAKQQLALIKPEATIGPVDPYNSVSEADILNRNDPAVIERLKGTYWFTLPVEEQDRRYEALKAEYDKMEKSYAEKNRLHASGVGNQTLANILMGGSNIIGNAINTGSFGIAGTVTEWIMGPEPEGYVNPLDNAYGKKAGQTLGTFVSIGLPWKFLNGVKTPGMVGKFSPTLYKSMIAGAVSGAIEETLDAFNDYRDDGKQSLSGRAFSVGINTVIAGAGDALFTVGSKALAGVKKFMKGPIREVELKGVEGSTSTKVENTGKPKEVEDPLVEGTGKAPKNEISEQVSDDEKLQRPYHHLVNVDGLKRGGRPGISGGHNMDNFYTALQEDASKYGLSVQKDYIVGELKKHPVEGIYEVEYQIPSLQRTEKDKSNFEAIRNTEGNVVGKRVNDPKTVYDPNIISDEKMYNWGKAALEPQIQAGHVKNGIVKGELDGLKFVGFVDENGKITNFYPTFDYKD